MVYTFLIMIKLLVIFGVFANKFDNIFHPWNLLFSKKKIENELVNEITLGVFS
jgi:hypothetical protein